MATAVLSIGSTSSLASAATTHGDVQAAAGGAMVRLATRALTLARKAEGEAHPVIRFHVSRVDNEYVDLLFGEVKFPQPPSGLLGRYQLWVYVHTPTVDRHRYRVFPDAHELDRLDPRQVMDVLISQERDNQEVTHLIFTSGHTGIRLDINGGIRDPISFAGFYSRGSRTSYSVRRIKTTVRPTGRLVQDFKDAGEQSMELLNATAEASPFELTSAVHPIF
jgi:hypothetical protein